MVPRVKARTGRRSGSVVKILHVVSLVAPRYGGLGIAAENIARNQAAAGHDVSLWSTNLDYPTGVLPFPTDREVEIDGVRRRHFPARIAALLVSPEMWRALKRDILSFDVVHAHGLYRFPVTAAAYIARKAGVPCVISPHGCLDPYLYQQSKHNLLLKRVYERLFDMPNLRRVDAIHYTAEEERERIADLNLTATPIIVPLGLDWEPYAELPARGAFRERAGVAKDAPLVLFLGRINFKKGMDILVDGFSKVHADLPNARLAIVGPDNDGYRAEVEGWVTEKGLTDAVVFIDHLGSEQVREAYVDADVFVLSSYTENFGMTVVEAMACRCPVVISDRVNIWREVNQEGAGIIVSTQSSEVAAAIRHLLTATEEAEVMGDRGRAAAESRYAWPRIVEQFVTSYQELMPGEIHEV